MTIASTKLIALLASIGLLASFLAVSTAGAQSVDDEAPREAATGRLAGDTRIGTAVAIARRAFPDGAATVYLANADQPVDAVAGGVLTDGPILLVGSCALPAEVAEELARLAPREVIALGGTAAVCDRVLQEAADAAGIQTGDASPDEEIRYTCGAFPFVPEEVLAQDTPAETNEGAVYDALRRHLEEGTGFGDYPEGPWYEVGVSDDRAEFLAEYDQPSSSQDSPLGVALRLRLDEFGEWQWTGAGECRPTAHHQTFGPATWDFEGSPLQPGATTFTALVTERACASGQSSAGRVQPPVIEYRADVVIVTFFVDPLGGAQNCPSNPATPASVQLSEPLDGRELLDGGLWPARQPAVATL